MLKLTMRLAAVLVLILVFSGTALAAGPSAVSLSVDKSAVRPGEPLTVSFSVNPGLKGNAWIGIIPSHVAHGSEAVNDQNDVTYQYLQNRTSGTMSFTAPMAPGSYDFRFHDTDDNGVELAFVSFVVGGQRSSATVPDKGFEPQGMPYGGNEATLRIDKSVYRQGEQIRLHFTAPAHYAENAWIGIIPSHISHGNEAVNDQNDITYQYVQKRTSGEMLFTAPQPGRWDFRLNDTDNNGREAASVSFTVY